ncbi:hypothetical protein Hanom_Chr03g00186211 [Helianthus anomalus]
MNTWDTIESFSKKKMIPDVRLISVMIVQKSCLPEESLWVTKPVDDFDFAKMTKGSKIYMQSTTHHHVFSNRKTGYTFSFHKPVQGEYEEMEEDKEESSGR